MRKREQSGELSTDVSSYNTDTNNPEELGKQEEYDSYTLMKPERVKDNHDDSNSQFPFCIDTLQEGVFVLDDSADIQYCNQTFLHMLGYDSPSELEGLHISQVITNESIDLFKKEYKETLLGRGGFFSPYKAKKKDGLVLWIDGLSCTVTFQDTLSNMFFVRDITKQRNALNDLGKLEKKYRTIADLSANGIITIDPLGKITYANKSFEQMIKREGEELDTIVFRELLTDEYIYQFQQILLKVRKEQKNRKHVELYLKVSEDDELPVELSIAPVFEDEVFLGYICTIQDIKERKRFEEEIKKSEKLKTEFMNIVAHELKSPVTPIKGYLDLIISDESTNERIKKWGQIGLRNANRLLLLVNDILDVSRLDNDTMKFEMRKIDPSSLFQEIIEDMKPLVQNKELRFDVNIQSELPAILGDYNRLNQVLRNLLTNAIKFTDEGSISLNAYRKDKNLVFEVADTGIGMRQDEATHVFEKFYQAVTSENRKHEGTGLGLFICKEIIKKHRGNIQVKADLGQGSTFMVTIPAL